ncbi:MAG: preprotein translocase subunit SecG [Candidatus Omnitrophica bacterium CG11_big_fil_rev_8_21_14_0_20_45_26]|uniref:Protein-export membrane protein SecG n=1 Tax=Candidatus Abzuiibacterium crystallinum TaxID=1974748 RepID=A0A2H0LSC5_9BACT|nr:MAG: preprotein translocase subunit SecG [Candidatus Omnitrophica bacterium CG11_big_fil_rev_8_21_14_0_20_45_26]PIW65047.1 MAG: preprotein translocase subunit SecG [Candidatus Omnitrophica bacterium CG12_big_fil_rev_8_21_14_0_65_45_16]
MTTFIVIIHVIVCFILILVILLQAGRGSGLSWGTFGGTPQSFFGTKSASFLAKATSVAAIIFLTTCIALAILETKKSKSLFSNTPQTQVDVNKIKEVLNKIKAEETKGESTAAPTDTATPAEEKPTPPDSAAE